MPHTEMGPWGISPGEMDSLGDRGGPGPGSHLPAAVLQVHGLGMPLSARERQGMAGSYKWQNSTELGAAPRWEAGLQQQDCCLLSLTPAPFPCLLAGPQAGLCPPPLSLWELPHAFHPSKPRAPGQAEGYI